MADTNSMSPLEQRIKKEVSRLRSEVRAVKKAQQVQKEKPSGRGIRPSMISGNYWTQTGMPWVTSEGRKAVLTEYFWQPIRGQPRRVDTNELRQFSQDFWINACVKTIIDEICSLDWDIVPTDDYEYDWVADQITQVKDFLENPNKNGETFAMLIRALLKDILEIDAGVIVKVFDIQSYEFDEVEPKSGAPMLKPKGQRRMTELYVRDGASFLKEIDKFGFCKGYWQYSYQIPAHPMWFNDPEIVYVSEQNRSMSCYGYSRVQAVLDIVKSLHYSTLYNKKFFEESPIPDGALSVLDTSETEMENFMEYWNTEFKAQPHKIAVVNKDVKWQPFNITHRELEFLDTQKSYFNFVISIFGLSPSELGMTEDLNRATSATQSELVKRKSIRPFLKLLENAINKHIIPEFNFEGIEFQFIYDDPAEKKARLENWQMELSMGVKTINEVRNELGLEPVPGGDVSTNLNSQLNNAMNPYAGMQSRALPDDTEQQQSPGYTSELDRSEAEAEKKDAIKQPFRGESRPTTGFKSATIKAEYTRMNLDELIAEHKRLVQILETGTDSEQMQEAEDQRRELEHYIEQRKKDVEKKKIYLKPGDKAPEGYAVQEGKAGGRYYESEAREGKEEEDGVQQPGQEDQQQDPSSQELPEIDANELKEVIRQIPERDSSGVSTGNCKVISEAVQSYLQDKGIGSAVQPVHSAHSSGGHVAVYIPEWDVVVDSQLWQYEEGEDKPLDERQIIFSKHDYAKRGYEIGQSPDKEHFKEGRAEYYPNSTNFFAHKRFDLSKATKLSGGGSDRSAYRLPDGNVIKIAKGPRGLMQNDAENDAYMNLIPEVHEAGKDYVVVDYVERDDSRTKDLLKNLRKLSMTDWDNKTSALQDELQRLDEQYGDIGFTDVMNYDLLWNDFISPRNWGWKGDRPYHLDGGTFNKNILDKDFVNEFKSDWDEIVSARRTGRRSGDEVLTKSSNPEMNVEKPGMGHSDKWWEVYHALVREGHSKESAARIANSKVNKGVNDGQYYHDQPISQARRPSGVFFQPQNTEPDTNPSQLGSSYADPARDDFKTAEEITCPNCGKDTLTVLNSMEDLPDDIRCTNCGARFKGEDLLAAPLMEAMYNVLQEFNISDPISQVSPYWSPKGLQKVKSEDMDAKSYVGFDVSKSANFSLEYAGSLQYERLLREYLGKKLTMKEIRTIIKILKTALLSGETLMEVAGKINKFVQDAESSMLIAKTELVRIANEGNILRMEKNGATGAEFISAPEDGRLCPKCKALDGKVFTLKESRGIIPVHPRCRCTMTEVFS